MLVFPNFLLFTSWISKIIRSKLYNYQIKILIKYDNFVFLIIIKWI